MMRTCKCGKEFEDEGFKTMCPLCFAQSVNGSRKRINSHTANNKDRDIHRQVFMKIASEQLKGVPVKEIICYAKELEKVFDSW